MPARDNKSLWVVPVIEDTSETGADFNAIIRKQFGDDHVFTKADVMFLRGIEAAHANYSRGMSNDARRLINMIDAHGKVRGWFQ